MTRFCSLVKIFSRETNFVLFCYKSLSFPEVGSTCLLGLKDKDGFRKIWVKAHQNIGSLVSFLLSNKNLLLRYPRHSFRTFSRKCTQPVLNGSTLPRFFPFKRGVLLSTRDLLFLHQWGTSDMKQMYLFSVNK